MNRLITTPIFYCNARPHIGHLYSAVLADAVKRWSVFRCAVSPVHLIKLSTGTDEHGIKVQQAAAAHNTSPRQHCDSLSNEFKMLFDKAQVSHDYFIRTTQPAHHEAVKAMWIRLRDKGHIYKGAHEGYYSVTDEMFYTQQQVQPQDSYLMGPNSGSCMIAVETGSRVEWVREENYMFRLSRFRDDIRHWLLDKPDIIQPRQQLNQVLSWLDQSSELPDISVSRPRTRQSWGIPVPDDQTQTVYVWLDALTNYLTVCGYPGPNDCSPNTAVYHVIGKDILKFHAIYWPAFLMAAGMRLPDRIISHGHWLMGNSKMSKSLGNVVDPGQLLDRFGVDGVRYFLLRDGNIADDSRFSEEMIMMRYQVELADQLGNLLARCTSKGLNPESRLPPVDRKQFSDDEHRLIDSLNHLRDSVDPLFDGGDFHRGLGRVMQTLKQVNQYISHREPWNLIKQPSADCKQKAQITLYCCLEALRIIGLLLQPVIPQAADKLLFKLGVPSTERNWNCAQFTDYPGEREIPSAKLILFPRLSQL